MDLLLLRLVALQSGFASDTDDIQPVGGARLAAGVLGRALAPGSLQWLAGFSPASSWPLFLFTAKPEGKARQAAPTVAKQNRVYAANSCF